MAFLNNELQARTYRNIATKALDEVVRLDNLDPEFIVHLTKLEGALDNLYNMARK
jgi:hypothetical protein